MKDLKARIETLKLLEDNIHKYISDFGLVKDCLNSA